MNIEIHQSEIVSVWFGDVLVLVLEPGEDVGKISMSIEKKEEEK